VVFFIDQLLFIVSKYLLEKLLDRITELISITVNDRLTAPGAYLIFKI